MEFLLVEVQQHPDTQRKEIIAEGFGRVQRSLDTSEVRNITMNKINRFDTLKNNKL